MSKLLCYLFGHKPNLVSPYLFTSIDGEIKVVIKSSLPCPRCGKEIHRQTEPFEWPLIVSGKAVSDQ